jgi:hypothetical protein
VADGCERAFSLLSEVKSEMSLSSTFDHNLNWCFHCSTDTLQTTDVVISRQVKDQNGNEPSVAYPEVQSTSVLFLIVQAAVMPTSVLPAPHGRMMIPLRARLHKAHTHTHAREEQHRQHQSSPGMESSKTICVAKRGDVPVSKHLAEALLLIVPN